MSTATAFSRESRIRAGLIIALVASFLAALVPAPAEAAVDGNAEAQFVAALNQERAARGLPKLAVASDLVAVARQHSARMASKNDLYHNPNLGSDVSGWQKVGENVGRGPSVSTIHDAFMNSAGHRANILDADWTEVGVGVEVVDGRVWVTEVFRQPQKQASEPAPAPKTEAEKKAPTPAPKKEASTSGAPAQDDPAASGSGTQSGSGSEEGSEDPAPLPALADRAMTVMVRVESEERG